MAIPRHRLVYLGLSLALVAVVALAVAFGSPQVDRPPRPTQVEAIHPQEGDSVPRQTRIEVDLPVGYRVELFVDDLRIPEESVQFVEGTGVVSWDPRSQPELLDWSPGEHRVLVRWDTVTGLPDPGEYEWSFRVY